MRLEKASHKAIKYACMNFHYAKAIPYASVGYSVFNENKQWCGVVLFNRGNINAGKTYGCEIGEVAELIRVALNGNQVATSKAVALAVRIFKKDNPLCKIIISYADTGQNHSGIIYQAMNWFYEGEIKPTRPKFKDKNGKIIHSRVAAKLKTAKIIESYDDIYQRVANTNKHRYTYPLHKSLVPLCQSLAKPYPKKHAAVAHTGEHLTSSQEGAFDSTLPLKTP
jgi:hypothetical protein